MNAPLPTERFPQRQRRWPRVLALLAVAVVLLALVAATFVLSYAGVHRVALQAGVSAQPARIYPGILDAALVIACLAALMLRDGKWWARSYAWFAIILVVVVAGGTNAVHAMNVALPHKQTSGVVAAAPWVLVLLAFSLWLTILRQSRGAQRPAPATNVVPNLAPDLAPDVAPATAPVLALPPAPGFLAERPVAEQPPMDPAEAGWFPAEEPRAEDSPTDEFPAIQADAIQADADQADADQAETEQPEAEQPAGDEPAAEAPAVEGAETEAPAAAAGAPEAEAPAAEAPKAEAEAAEAATAEEPPAAKSPAEPPAAADGGVVTEEFDYWHPEDDEVPADNQAAVPAAAGDEDAPDEDDSAATSAASRRASAAEVHHSLDDAEPQEPWVPFAAVPRLRRVRSTPVPPEEEEQGEK